MMENYGSDKSTIFSQISIKKNNKTITDDFDLYLKGSRHFLRMLLNLSIISQIKRKMTPRI